MFHSKGLRHSLNFFFYVLTYEKDLVQYNQTYE